MVRAAHGPPTPKLRETNGDLVPIFVGSEKAERSRGETSVPCMPDSTIWRRKTSANGPGCRPKTTVCDFWFLLATPQLYPLGNAIPWQCLFGALFRPVSLSTPYFLISSSVPVICEQRVQHVICDGLLWEKFLSFSEPNPRPLALTTYLHRLCLHLPAPF